MGKTANNTPVMILDMNGEVINDTQTENNDNNVQNVVNNNNVNNDNDKDNKNQSENNDNNVNNDENDNNVNSDNDNDNDKTFTQEEVNTIIKERLAREKNDNSNIFLAQKSLNNKINSLEKSLREKNEEITQKDKTLTEKTLHIDAYKLAAEYSVNVDEIMSLRGNTYEELKNSAEKVLKKQNKSVDFVPPKNDSQSSSNIEDLRRFL